MKVLNLLLSSCLVLLSVTLTAQIESDSTGLLGDHFSLEGTLDVFKTAESLEDFETAINKQDNNINNLDLNEDGETDYVRVEDNHEGDVHAIVLQAVLSKDEFQDIAVIEIEKNGDESATLQIVGDELLYGNEHFVEPFEEQAESDGKGGPNADYLTTRLVVNVWFWPSVRYVYRPGYRIYRSPYHWGYYPRIWRPWRPLSWRSYHVNRAHYTHRYRVVSTHRVVRAHKVYTPKRKTCNRVTVKSRTVTRVNRSNGTKTVRKTNTKTVVKRDANGNVKAGAQTKKRGVKKDGKGNVTKGKSKTTTKKKNGKATKKTKTVKKKRKG